MEGWASTLRHVADEITLLCNRHHAEKTKGLLPLTQVREANTTPYNVKAGLSSPYGLYFSGDTCHVNMGSCNFSGSQTEFVPIAIRDEEFVVCRFVDGQLFLDVQIRDRNGDIALLVRGNEMTLSMTPWDIEFVGKTLTIRQGSRDILLEIEFEPPAAIDIKRMDISFDGNGIKVDKDAVYAYVANGPAVKFRNFAVTGCRYGAVLACTQVKGFAGIRL